MGAANFRKNVAFFPLFLMAVFVVAGMGSFATRQTVKTWYPALSKPFWAPPDAVFGPVWTVLYVLIGIAGWRVWAKRGKSDVYRALVLYFVQLGLNLIWPFLFFFLQNPGLAALEIAGLLGVILLMLSEFRKIDVPASLMLVPYALWVAFATALNVSIWYLNLG